MSEESLINYSPVSEKIGRNDKGIGTSINNIGTVWRRGRGSRDSYMRAEEGRRKVEKKLT